jgi:salicylate hydroxylase
MVKISELLSQNKDLNCWGIFDLGDHPLSTYTKGRMCLTGDAAHAR